ncbi:hypothetical protein ZEAMMB73_Zm00001d040971 [Zea mays]|uniref:Uncharacterized protein n=1 Tax=Zea mays TaxID=4577 RepID=A0A1D6MTM3_MAIZE|nr:hypothetical protein ZEAMMB73_Zm00001d040971 [Zea mays]
MSTDHHGLMSVDDIASRLFASEPEADVEGCTCGVSGSVYTGVEFCIKLFAVSIVQRADELQTVLMEMVKQDSRHQLSAKGELKEL